MRGKIVPSKKEYVSRGRVVDFSYKSERRMRLMLEDTSDIWKVFSVLTYPGEFPYDGKKVKRDILGIIRWLKRQGVKDIFWGIEFQQRGAPHINLLLSSGVEKERLSRAWFKIVGSGDPRHLTCGTSIEAIKNKDRIATYVVGYQYKRKQKDVPDDFKNVGRFWGCTRKAKESCTYSYRYDGEDVLSEAVAPIAEYYKGKMAEWSKYKDEPYTWRFKGNSFMCWGGAEEITKMIEEGIFVGVGA